MRLVVHISLWLTNQYRQRVTRQPIPLHLVVKEETLCHLVNMVLIAIVKTIHSTPPIIRILYTGTLSLLTCLEEGGYPHPAQIEVAPRRATRHRYLLVWMRMKMTFSMRFC